MPLDEPLLLPTPSEPARRPPLPVLGSIVPVVAAIIMWLVTGSILMLAFAALGPLIAVASVVDGARTARRDRRRSSEAMATARRELTLEVARRHRAEREARDAVHPGAGRLLLRQDEVWRPVPGRSDHLVVGRGDARSEVRVIGGDHSSATASARAAAVVLGDCPVTIPIETGVCVVGPRVAAVAVARALAVQLCLAQPPDALGLVSAPADEGAWADPMPHRRQRAGRARRVALVVPGETASMAADVVIGAVPPGAPIPPGCGAVLTLTGLATARLEWGAEARDLRVEALSLVQAADVAAELALRAEAMWPAAAAPAVAALGDLLQSTPVAGGVLSAVIGADSGDPVTVDLVADGPHAIVTGITGTGKSELLLTWVTSLCSTHTPREVAFLLADFKGGMAFDALATLPHVTGIITDLDGSGAMRAILSLRAELRRREAELARIGARDIADPRVDLPRLVIVVDEFAALLAESPELHAVFVDIAARGRALGMHLVLGTQRASGVLRDALLANCPLRISLRVADSSDSRAMIGTDEAALLPGDPQHRGMALVLRAGDSEPTRVRIALSSAHDVDAAARAAAAHPAPRRPWLPPLPRRLPLAELAGLAAGGDSGGEGDRILLGLVDEPERQRQVPLALEPGIDRGITFVGGARSGKSCALDVIAAQVGAAAVRIPGDAEGAWDALEELAAGGRAGSVVLIDDLDALPSRFPPEYSHAVLARIEALVRDGGATGVTVALAAQRLAGPAGRIADLLARRIVLAMPSRAEHIAAGGDPGAYSADAPPGRGTAGPRVVQLALAPAGQGTPAPARPAEPWHPTGAVSAVVARDVRAVAASLERSGEVRAMRLDELEPGTSAASMTTPRLGGQPVVLVGHGEGWQRQWALLSGLRADHEIVVDAACPAEYRAITGDRGLPPYAEPGRGRAWLCRPDGSVARVSLPGHG